VPGPLANGLPKLRSDSRRSPNGEPEFSALPCIGRPDHPDWNIAAAGTVAMDADRFSTIGLVARDGAEAAAAMGWLGRGADDPVFLCCAWRTYRESRRPVDQRHDHWLHDTDTFRRNGFRSQDRHQPATLIEFERSEAMPEARYHKPQFHGPAIGL
jgi:hypothetical protein